MGLVIKISYGYDWEKTYFVQCMDETEAKKKAFKMFKDTQSCWLPDTLEEAEQDDNLICEIIAIVEQIII